MIEAKNEYQARQNLIEGQQNFLSSIKAFLIRNPKYNVESFRVDKETVILLPEAIKEITANIKKNQNWLINYTKGV